MDVTDEMVEAATDALCRKFRYTTLGKAWPSIDIAVRAALEAAAPAMLAAERECIAQAIEAEREQGPTMYATRAFSIAAGIARGES